MPSMPTGWKRGEHGPFDTLRLAESLGLEVRLDDISDLDHDKLAWLYATEPKRFRGAILVARSQAGWEIRP